jgi:hypothetical protein
MVPADDLFLRLLSECLQKIELRPEIEGRPKGTRTINGALIDFCKTHHARSAREVDLRLFHPDAENWHGRLDWVMRLRNKATPAYAIEIDSSNKKNSLAKLLKARQLQYVPVWIRWNTPISMDIPEEILLLDLTSPTPYKQKKKVERLKKIKFSNNIQLPMVTDNKGQPWTPAREKELIALYSGGAGAAEIASTIGRTRGAVRSHLVKLGIIADRKDLKR